MIASGTTVPDVRILFPRGPAGVRGKHFDARSMAGSLLTVLAVAGLLVALGLVVRQSVQQGDASRRAMALQAEVDWRCSALKLRGQRERCIALVQEHKPWDSTGVQALVQRAGSAAARP